MRIRGGRHISIRTAALGGRRLRRAWQEAGATLSMADQERQAFARRTCTTGASTTFGCLPFWRGDRGLGAGLDLRSLQALRLPRFDEAELVERIEGHLEQHDGYIALSGGKDSVVVLHLALQAEPNVPVVWFDSGLEYPETTRYLEELQKAWNLQLHRILAEPSLLEVLWATGAWDHRAAVGTAPDLHTILITEPSARAHLDFVPGELWRVRSSEARGRAALYASALAAESRRAGVAQPGSQTRRSHGGRVRRQDGTVAFGAIWDWTDADVWAYLARHAVPVNPVYDKLRRLGAPRHAQRCPTWSTAMGSRTGGLSGCAEAGPACSTSWCRSSPASASTSEAGTRTAGIRIKPDGVQDTPQPPVAVRDLLGRQCLSPVVGDGSHQFLDHCPAPAVECVRISAGPGQRLAARYLQTLPSVLTVIEEPVPRRSRNATAHLFRQACKASQSMAMRVRA
jgi:phosphoadenosine phosphosulfate reductase